MGVLLPLLALVLISCSPSVLGCSAPHGGCEPKVCSRYAGVSISTVSFPNADYSKPATWLRGSLPLIGYYQGHHNKQVNGGTYDKAGPAGTPALNLERFNLEDTIIDPRTKKPYAQPSSETTLVDCCNKCAETDGCYLFQFFPPETDPAFSKAVSCYLLSGGVSPFTFPERGTPFAGSQRLQKARSSIPLSFVGGRCNGTAKILRTLQSNSPHGPRFYIKGSSTL